MPQLIWSPAALRDVDRLYRFLADKNPDAARRAAKSIREGMQILRDQPGRRDTLRKDFVAQDGGCKRLQSRVKCCEDGFAGGWHFGALAEL